MIFFFFPHILRFPLHLHLHRRLILHRIPDHFFELPLFLLGSGVHPFRTAFRRYERRGFFSPQSPAVIKNRRQKPRQPRKNNAENDDFPSVSPIILR